MTTLGKCPIWGTDCTTTPSGYGSVIHSKRAGGRYVIMIDTQRQLASKRFGLKNDRERAILTTWILSRQREGDAPEVSREIIDRVQNRELKPISPVIRAEKLLRYLGETVDPGIQVSIRDLVADDEVLALTESVSEEDASLIVEWLDGRGWLSMSSSGGIVKVTLDGYQRLAELDTPNTNSHQVFVAMWFDDSTKQLRETIRQSIESVGLTPYIVDEDSFENKICDKIVVEIRRSRLVVADFTHGEDGARGSVYYEAGLAKGLGLPVVWTCRESQMKGLHFDTNHYPHLGWEDDQLTDFRGRLSDRLHLLVGGP